MQSLDRKFSGTIVRNKDQRNIPVDQWIVFLAKDDAVLPTLIFYREECEKLGAGREQIDGIADLITRVRNWRIANPDQCKIPDAEIGECG